MYGRTSSTRPVTSTDGSRLLNSTRLGRGLRPTTVRVTSGFAALIFGNTESENQLMASSLGNQSIDPVKTRFFERFGITWEGLKNSVSTPVGTSSTFWIPNSCRIVSASFVETATTISNFRQADCSNVRIFEYWPRK